MGIETAKTGALLYHLTSLDNFDSIVEHGLLPRKAIFEKGIRFDDIADQDIISERQMLGLDKYTPFHFHPYSAFDVAVKHTYNAQELIYLCVFRNVARANDFKILPQHPLSGEGILFNYDEGFEQIDWDTLMEKNRFDQYAKEVKMAECLTDRIVPADCLASIFVPSERVKNIVLQKMKRISNPPTVYVQPQWFSNY